MLQGAWRLLERSSLSHDVREKYESVSRRAAVEATDGRLAGRQVGRSVEVMDDISARLAWAHYYLQKAVSGLETHHRL